MADVSGPCSTLPGASWLSDGEVCDTHPDRQAVRRVQGETDSFGAEYHHLCEECLEDAKRYREQDRVGKCDWCNSNADDLRYRRDFEEGSCGPVYRVCGACVVKENKAIEMELSEYEYDTDWGDDE